MTAAAAVPVAASTALARALAGERRRAWALGWSPAALYLGVDGGDVVAVVGPDSVRLPVAVVTGGAVPRLDAGRAESAFAGGGGLQLGDLTMRPARWFEPRPRLRGDLDLAAAGRLRRRALAVGRFAAAEVTDAEADGVASALCIADGAAGRRDATRLAATLLGRGPGLTPSGDDVLAGVLAALSLRGRLDAAHAEDLLQRAQDRTTALSAALLRCAARGEVIPQVAALLHALEGRGDLDVAMHRLLQVGASSGAALALGLLAGVEALQGQEAGR